jgi:drug/metabolite transporter (DMT)-like permease
MRSRVPPFALLLLAVGLRVVTQVWFKTAALLMKQGSEVFLTVLTALAVGIVLVFIRSVAWLKALQHYPLSYAYPFLGLTLIMLLAFGVLLFNEPVTWTNVAGTILILASLLILAAGKREAHE